MVFEQVLFPRKFFGQEVLYLFLPVLLEGTHESCFVLRSLKPSMAKLGAGVDELEVDLLQGSLLGVR